MKSPLILVGLVVLVSSLVAPAAVTVRNHYRMGESDPGAANGGTNPTTRDTVGTNHLTTAGGPTYSNDVGFETAARTGSALSMNFPSGGSRSASGALLANVTDNFGLELWVKTTTASGSHCLAYNGSSGSSGWGIFQVGNTFQGLFGGVAFFGSAPVVTNVWTHLALVRQAGTATFYVNGVASGSTTAPPLVPMGSFAVGAAPPALNSGFISGLADEVRFFTFTSGEFTTDKGLWAITAWTNDASSGLAPGVAWAYHFGATTTGTVNSVSVPGIAGGNPAVSNQFTFGGLGLNFLNDSNALTALGGSGSAVLAHDFVYGGNPGAITLQGLTIGQNYRVTILGVGFDAALARRSTFSGGFDSVTVDENNYGNDQGLRLDYTFAASSTNRVLSITPEVAGQTFHIYGLALRPIFPEIAVQQPVGTVLATGSANCAGRNNYGQIITPLAGQYGVRLIAGGENHTLAVRNDGTVIAWGRNNEGQTTVPGGLTGVVAISAGTRHSLALKSDGTLAAWGGNTVGETYLGYAPPGITAIAAGNSHNLVLTSNGTVVAWGGNSQGQTNVPAGLTGVAAIAAGSGHSMALKSNGTVVAWGYNDVGQANVPAGLTNVVAISAGWLFSMALKSDGTVVAWGYNNVGQTDMPAGLTGVVAIAAGGYHAVALKSDGAVVAWGGNFYGQTDIAFVTGTRTIAAGGEHTLLLLDGPATFSKQPVGTTSSAKSFTIKSTGLDPLSVSGVTLTGSNATDFTVSTSGTLTALPATNGQTTFTVTFSPGAVGARIARLRVANNDSDENPYEIALIGTGLPTPEIAVFTGAGTAPANERTDNVGTNLFATTPVGSNVGQTFTITNLGTTNLTGLAVSKSGVNSGDFILSALGAMTLAPNAATTFTVTFAPTFDGVRSAVVAIASNDGDENPFEINVSGLGVGTPEIAVFNGFGTAPANERTDHVGTNVFATTPVGSNVGQTFTITNFGTADLTGLALSKSGANSGDFTLSALGTTTLAPNVATTFTVTFAPTFDGVRNAVVAIASNDGDENPFEINVSGLSVGNPEIAVEQSGGTNIADGGSQDFGSVNIGTNVALAFKLRNLGSSDLILSGTPKVAISGANAGDFTVTSQPLSPVLAGGVAVGLTNAGFEAPAYSPGGWSYAAGGTGWTIGSAAGLARNGSPWFVNSAPEGGQAAFLQLGGPNASVSRAVNFPGPGNYLIRFALVRRGSGYEANDVAVRMDGITLGTILNTSQPDDVWRTFAVPYNCTNAGSHTLAFVGTRGGADNASALDAVEILEGTFFQITFAPSAVGTRTATLSIANNDSDENPFDINLNGVGVGAPVMVIEQPGGNPLPTGRVFAWSGGLSQSNVPVGMKSIQAIAQGSHHIMALRSNGTVVAWGQNEEGQTNVPAGLTNIQAIAAGPYYSLALRRNGTVVAWGDNGSGQTNVPVGLTNVQAIAGGQFHTVVLQSNGTVIAWGYDGSGQVTGAAGMTNIQAIAAGYDHTIVVRNDGTVSAWGDNEDGQVTVPAGLTNIQAVAAGAYHNVVLLSNGTVIAWGQNNEGQTTVPVGLTGVRAIAAGYAHTVALRSNGTVVAWGNNGQGQTTVPVWLTNVQAIAAGGFHTVALADFFLNYGTQAVATASAPRTFTVRNVGNLPLNLTNVTLLGGNTADFTVNTSGMLAQVPASGLTTFTVTFTPGAVGGRTTTLRVLNNDPTVNPFDLVLAGTGVAVEVIPPPPIIRASSLTVLGNGAFQFTFANTNNATFTVLASTNIALPLTNWTVLGTATNLGGGLSRFTDFAATNAAQRFYQLRFP